MHLVEFMHGMLPVLRSSRYSSPAAVAVSYESPADTYLWRKLLLSFALVCDRRLWNCSRCSQMAKTIAIADTRVSRTKAASMVVECSTETPAGAASDQPQIAKTRDRRTHWTLGLLRTAFSMVNGSRWLLCCCRRNGRAMKEKQQRGSFFTGGICYFKDVEERPEAIWSALADGRKWEHRSRLMQTPTIRESCCLISLAGVQIWPHNVIPGKPDGLRFRSPGGHDRQANFWYR